MNSSELPDERVFTPISRLANPFSIKNIYSADQGLQPSIVIRILKSTALSLATVVFAAVFLWS